MAQAKAVTGIAGKVPDAPDWCKAFCVQAAVWTTTTCRATARLFRMAKWICGKVKAPADKEKQLAGWFKLICAPACKLNAPLAALKLHDMTKLACGKTTGTVCGFTITDAATEAVTTLTAPL